MKVWITRTEPGASRTAERVRALGLEPLVAPLLEVQPLPVLVDLGAAGALAFTSPNAVRAFAALCPDRGLPVFAVGEATAEAARAAAFASVASADGDVDGLAKLIGGARGRFAGEVFAPGAREPAGDLIGTLQSLGVAARAQAVYETRPVSARDALQALPTIGAVLIHSPKAGRRLAELLAPLDVNLLAAYCISPAAAAPLANLKLNSVKSADFPNEQSLLKLLPS